MKYFKDNKDNVFAYDDDVSKETLDTKIKDLGLTSITGDEMTTLTKVEQSPEDIRTKARQTGEAYTLNGTDYMVPFTKNDGDAVMQVNAGFQMGLLETKIHFSNETVMPIKSTEFQEFAVWFVNKRNSFFI